MTDLSMPARADNTTLLDREPSDLAVAVHVAQKMLDVYGDSSNFADIFAYAQAHGGLTEALRILLRAHGIEAGEQA
jgi:hypothetical protein